jgi:hypothetical protein
MKVGDKLRDNDPRMGNRVLTIVDLLPHGVVAVDSMGKVRRYLSKHIHSDGKPRRSGFSLTPGMTPFCWRQAPSQLPPIAAPKGGVQFSLKPRVFQQYTAAGNAKPKGSK